MRRGLGLSLILVFLPKRTAYNTPMCRKLNERAPECFSLDMPAGLVAYLLNINPNSSRTWVGLQQHAKLIQDIKNGLMLRVGRKGDSGSSAHQILTPFFGLILLHGSIQTCTCNIADVGSNWPIVGVQLLGLRLLGSDCWGLPWNNVLLPKEMSSSQKSPAGCLCCWHCCFTVGWFRSVWAVRLVRTHCRILSSIRLWPNFNTNYLLSHLIGACWQDVHIFL